MIQRAPRLPRKVACRVARELWRGQSSDPDCFRYHPVHRVTDMLTLGSSAENVLEWREGCGEVGRRNRGERRTFAEGST